MFKLRQTWTELFPNKKLYTLDVRINHIDPAWPISAPAPQTATTSIHVNPKFLLKVSCSVCILHAQKKLDYSINLRNLYVIIFNGLF